MSVDSLRDSGYPVDCVVVKMPSIHRDHFCLEMHSDDPDLVIRFKQIVWDEMTCNRLSDPDYEEKHSWGTFWQGSSSGNSLTAPSDWECFELWHDPTPAFQTRVIAKAADIADQLECPWAVQ